jgi:hypothetical protein
MNNQKELSAYLNRLCDAAREKSLLGQEADSASYFMKAIDMAKTSTDFITISLHIFRSDLQGNKYFAYTCFLRALEVSSNPVRIFKRSLRRKDLTFMITEFMAKMPDHFFHFMLDKCVNDEETRELAGAFRPLSIYISDPDPLIILGQNLRKAS